jgi:hypothetical protein
LKILKTIKFVLLDHPDLPSSVKDLLAALGLTLQRKSRERVSSFPPTELRKGYKVLGYKVTTNTQRQSMVDALVMQHPSQSLVYQKVATAWCMAPIKSKRKDVIESFRQGNLAEPKINENVIPFINTNTNGCVYVVRAFNVGLIKAKWTIFPQYPLMPYVSLVAVHPDWQVTTKVDWTVMLGN